MFTLKPLYQRALIVFGGPLANFILALAIFFQFMLLSEKILHQQLLMKFKKIVLQWLVVLKADDIILEIDGNEVQSIMDVSKFITMSTSDFIDFKVKRSYEELILKVKPNIVEGDDGLGNKINKRMVGIKLVHIIMKLTMLN